VIGLIWGTELPLGVPNEWTWARAEPAAPVVLTFVSLALAAIGYFAFVWIGANRIERSRPMARAGWLIGLFLAGCGWLWTAQESAPESYQLSKAAWVLYSPGASGYFTEARADPRPLGTFLRDYERRMSEGDVLHIGTHPPGLIVIFRGLLALCREFPRLTDFVVASEPDSVRLSLDALAETGPPGRRPLDRIDRAVLWLAGFLAQSVAALTVLPLFGLLRQSCSARASWLAAALWPTVPAVAIFLPKSDALFPFLTALILWLWLTGAERGLYLRCILAGFTLWLALCLSLAFLPIAFLAAVVTGWSRWLYAGGTGDRGPGTGKRYAESDQSARQTVSISAAFHPSSPVPGPRSLFRSITYAALGFALPILALRLLAGINLPAVWWLNLRNHAGFYRQFTRTYWKWLLVNPIELAIAAGLPLVCLAVYAVVRQWRAHGWRACRPAVAFLATWGILWLSGKNMGEAARLWIFLIPCLIWIAGGLFEEPFRLAHRTAEERTPLFGFWSAALTAQLIVCAALVTRVVGFQYS
jgi:hypothetical protein